MEISFPAARAKFVRVTQTGSLKANEKDVFWSVNEIRVLQPAAAAQAKPATRPAGK